MVEGGGGSSVQSGGRLDRDITSTNLSSNETGMATHLKATGGFR
jgi:hypothetical protein